MCYRGLLFGLLLFGLLLLGLLLLGLLLLGLLLCGLLLCGLFRNSFRLLVYLLNRRLFFRIFRVYRLRFNRRLYDRFLLYGLLLYELLLYGLLLRCGLFDTRHRLIKPRVTTPQVIRRAKILRFGANTVVGCTETRLRRSKLVGYGILGHTRENGYLPCPVAENARHRENKPLDIGHLSRIGKNAGSSMRNTAGFELLEPVHSVLRQLVNEPRTQVTLVTDTGNTRVAVVYGGNNCVPRSLFIFERYDRGGVQPVERA